MFLVFFRLCTYVEYNVEVHVRTYVFTVYNVYIVGGSYGPINLVY